MPCHLVKAKFHEESVQAGKNMFIRHFPYDGTTEFCGAVLRASWHNFRPIPSEKLLEAERGNWKRPEVSRARNSGSGWVFQTHPLPCNASPS